MLLALLGERCSSQVATCFSSTDLNLNLNHQAEIVHYFLQQVVISQERNYERITEQTVNVPVPQVMEGIVESEYVAPARRRRTVKSVASPLDGAKTAPATVIEFVASSPAIAYAAAESVTEYVASSPAVTCAAPAPVIEYVASSPAEVVLSPAHDAADHPHLAIRGLGEGDPKCEVVGDLCTALRGYRIARRWGYQCAYQRHA